MDKEVKDNLIRQTRCHTFDVDEFLDDVKREHRTHQATIIRNLLEVVKKYHVAVGDFTDPRNETAKQVSKKINELEGTYIPYI
jgi:cell division septum initiation protein DivIVA